MLNDVALTACCSATVVAVVEVALLDVLGSLMGVLCILLNLIRRSLVNDLGNVLARIEYALSKLLRGLLVLTS